MKTHLFISLLSGLFLIASPSQAQRSYRPLKSVKAYVKIASRVVNYAGKQYASVYPELRQPAQDSTAVLMQRYHRRFEYILQNKTQFNDLADWYPDTVRMNAVYTHRLEASKSFLMYLNQLLKPLITPARGRPITYRTDELMLVASRFFLCDQVRPDTTVSWHVCIGLNGMKEANWPNDYTLLEAFCFEAIFDKMFSKNPEDTRYMNQFLKAVDESTQKRKPFMTGKVHLLEQVRRDVFRAMQSDRILQTHLLSYYHQHAATLPFRILEGF
ncbi:hypothetical protein [Larkinella rosea]|uniref:Uncharacterized protein n=1 Tax=Larkinella rosea TaxID=2025312 RepID=A0A3P1BJF9_9BACT|nr:hypothetical protein [Larkinella rosea]RRB01145.1 hypothetical protein EHT25_23510 [Larkinella rosea]